MKKMLSIMFIMMLLSTISFGQNKSATSSTELTYFTAQDISYINLTTLDDYNCFAYFPSSMISQHTGENISKIDFNISTQGNTVNSVKICIWTDTSNVGANPDYEQVVDNLAHGWNEITLTTPYTLGTEGIFVGYSINGQGFCVGIEEEFQSAEPNGYGDMVQYSDGYVLHTGSNPFMPTLGDIAVKAHVSTLEDIDLELSSIDTDPYSLSGMVDISGTVKNLGSSPITSFDVTYTVDGNTSEVYSVSDVNITTGTTGSFTHNVPADLNTLGEHSVSIDITNVNAGGETILDNNTLATNIYSVQEWVQRKMLHELFQAPTNPESRAANIFLNEFVDNNEDKATIIKYPMNIPDAGDPYYTAEVGVRSDFYGGITTIPTLKMNGSTFNTFDMSQGLLDEIAKGSFFKIEGTASYSGNSIQVNVNITSVLPVEGDLVAQIAVLEKTTTGNTGTNEQTEFHNVMIKFADSPSGNTLNNFEAGIPQSISTTADLEGTFVEEIEDTRILVWIQDNTTKEVYQSAYIDIPSAIVCTEGGAFMAYPNPTNSKVKLENVGNSEIVISNLLGEVVYRTFASENTLSIDLSMLHSGNYIIKMTKGNTATTRKITLIK